MSEYFTFIFIYIYFVKDLSRGFNYIYNSTFVDFTFQLILRFGKMFSRRGKSFLLEDRFHQASGHEFIFFNYGRFMTGVAQLFVDWFLSYGFELSKQPRRKKPDFWLENKEAKIPDSTIANKF